MKLVKTLLPIAGLGCVAAAVVPTIASCGSSSGWINAVADLDPEAKGFKKCAAEDIPLTQDLWTKNYVETIAQDKQVVYNDFEYSSSLLGALVKKVPEIVFEFLPTDVFAIKSVHAYQFATRLSDFQLDVIQYMATYTIDAKIDYEMKIELPALKERYQIDPEIVLNLTADLTAKFNSVPFYISIDYVNTTIAQLEAQAEKKTPPEAKGLAFLLDTDRMLVDPNWSMSIDVNAGLKATNKDIDLGLDAKTDGTYSFDVHNIFNLLFAQKISATVVSILGGWSTYYYSDFIVEGSN